MIKDYIFLGEKELIYKVESNFYKKEREADCYRKYRDLLIKKGYTPLNNITYTYSFDYKKTCRSKHSLTRFKYPYSIIVKYQTITSYNEFESAV